MRVLNPWLYKRLERVFGEVRVANAGIPLKVVRQYDPIEGKEKLVITQRGEAYQVNCPFCVYKVGRPDRRFRLWINHRWGFGTFDGKSKLWFLAICYNEDCLQVPENLQRLKQMVFGNQDIIIPNILDEPPTPESSAPQLTLPEQLIPINELKDDHPAVKYLKGRKFDPQILWKKYNVFFCPSSVKFPMASGRIIIPVHMGSTLYGWQARAIDASSIRYYSCPGSRLAQALYGWNQLDGSSYALLVEGATDVWRIGSPALALFGHHVSLGQLRLLQQRFNKVVLLLDGDLRRERDKIAHLRERLSTNFRQVKVYYLPEFFDPADLPSEIVPVLKSNIQQSLGDELCN